MKILIIEDEKPAARLLQRKIEKLGLAVNTLLHSVEESVEWFQNNNHPDLNLLFNFSSSINCLIFFSSQSLLKNGKKLNTLIA